DVHFPIVNVIITIVFTLLLLNAILKKYVHKAHHHECECAHDIVVYRVEGMKCNHCKANVEKNIASLHGIESVTADIVENTVTVHGYVDSEEIKKIVESLGFRFVGKDN
ncbi:MAG: heavy-metal-associated domain-containing protein, partial [Bacteroidales bacterium]|nr:heavy-metal-associated domain-containing protein [Bacteroidales bacterium]